MSLLRDKVAAVTGAASGLGRAIATAFAASGAEVFALDLREEHASELLGALNREGSAPPASFRQLDVRDPDAITSAFADIVASAGRLDVLVNSAGVREISDPLELEP